MTQVTQIPNPDTTNLQMPVLEVPDLEARKRHLLIVTAEKNLGESTNKPPKGLSADRLYISGRGSSHGLTSNNIWTLRREAPLLDVSSIFESLEAALLPGDITAEMVRFSVWELVWGTGDNIWVLDTPTHNGYCVLDQEILEEMLMSEGDDYINAVASINKELIEDKPDPSLAAGN